MEIVTKVPINFRKRISVHSFHIFRRKSHSNDTRIDIYKNKSIQGIQVKSKSNPSCWYLFFCLDTAPRKALLIKKEEEEVLNDKYLLFITFYSNRCYELQSDLFFRLVWVSWKLFHCHYHRYCHHRNSHFLPRRLVWVVLNCKLN